MEEIINELEITFKDVDDITDPESMEKVMIFLDQSRMEDDEYMQLLVDKLKSAEVHWEQPPYQMNFRLSQKPPPEETGLCANGHFTKAEGEIVKNNWKSFVRQYDVPDTPICLARWRNRTRSKNANRCEEERVRNFVAAYLAQGLQRNLYQVFRYFQITYSYPVKLRSYTATEEKIMEICFYHRPKDACVIASEVLGRERRGIIKKFTEYTKGKPEPKKRIKWTLKLAEKLIHLLMKHSGCKLKQLKYNQFNPQVWRKVEEKMGQTSMYLREFWLSKLHVQLFAKCSIRLKSLRKLIFRKLKTSPYELWSDIRWKDLVQEFPDGFTDMFLHNVAKREFRWNSEYRKTPLPKLIEEVAKKNKNRRNRRLKSLKYHKHDGTLSFIKYDVYVSEIMRDMTINQ